MTTKTIKWWKPDVYLKHLNTRIARGTVIKSIRSFFDADGFLEVDTPALQICPGVEVHLKSFGTEFDNPLGTKQQFYLHTSPELTMKKLITAGLPKIYQICHTYRNEGVSATHSPEFTMLEWYRTGADYNQIMQDTADIVRGATKACGATLLRRGERTCDPFQTWEKLTVQEAFLKYTGIDVLATVPDEPTLEPDPERLRAAAEKIGEKCSDTDRWEDIFFRIMLNHIEDKLGDGVPTILCEYPTCLGALARKKPDNPRVVERFEAYICGVEICNAFSELTDVVEQQERFEYDLGMKEKLYGDKIPVDEDFLDALRFGMPTCAGNAIGVDRLIMLITGADKITDTQWAPVMVD
ncbi:MAG: EF-P lysine aminoacylase GenX [Alphaproteobacteria bacterium]|nr:EF-P lysine aminoacylase GenX [Alphaproteobacteria bacterium]